MLSEYEMQMHLMVVYLICRFANPELDGRKDSWEDLMINIIPNLCPAFALVNKCVQNKPCCANKV